MKPDRHIPKLAEDPFRLLCFGGGRGSELTLPKRPFSVTSVTLNCRVDGGILIAILPLFLVIPYSGRSAAYHREGDFNGNDVWPFRNSE